METETMTYSSVVRSAVAKTPVAAVRTVLVALDEAGQAAAPVATAGWLARRHGACVNVLSVVEPASDTLMDDDSIAWARVDRPRSRRRIIYRALSGVSDAESWMVDIVTGSPVMRITECAHFRNVDLVIMGSRRVGRAIHDDTALRVVRRVSRPVLAASERSAVPARVAVAAVDFSRSSIHAARMAAHLVGSGGRLYLVHVQPTFTSSDERLRSIYSQGMSGVLDRAVAELDAPSDVAVDALYREGDVVIELERFIANSGADLSAFGSSMSLGSRSGVGHLTSAIVRAAERSILIAPPSSRSVL